MIFSQIIKNQSKLGVVHMRKIIPPGRANELPTRSHHNPNFIQQKSSVHMRCFARSGTTCTISKNMKNTHGGVLLLVKLQAKSNTPPRVFFTFFEIAQMVPNHATHHI